MSYFTPMASPRLRPAWIAATDILNDGQWHNRIDIVEAMLANSDVLPRTCAHVLRQGAHAGWLEKNGVGPKAVITYRLTDAGRDYMDAETREAPMDRSTPTTEEITEQLIPGGDFILGPAGSVTNG